MSCAQCGDIGIIRVPWSDAPDDFAVCLCPSGRNMRQTRNARKDTGFALWEVWAAREQVDPARVFLLEDVLTPAELAERGFHASVSELAVQSREAALLAAGRGKGVKL